MTIKYTVNAVGNDGRTYPIYFDCADIVDAENLIKQIGVVLDDAGVCELIESPVKRGEKNK